jgi:hypothetical protein
LAKKDHYIRLNLFAFIFFAFNTPKTLKSLKCRGNYGQFAL